jgi:hypothetical protein
MLINKTSFHQSHVVSESLICCRFSYFMTSFMTFSIFFSNTQKLCSEFHSCHFIKYWVIVARSYFRIRFFSIFSISKNFLIEIFFFISTDFELIDRERLYESNSSADFSWAMKIIEWIRDVVDKFSSYVKLFILRRMTYDFDRWLNSFEFLFFEREYSRWSRKYTLSFV